MHALDADRTIPTHVGRTLLSRLACRCVRTIPTHVGRTHAAEHRVVIAADHPHARGENVRQRTDRRDPDRTIPTHVGRTPSVCGHDHADRGPSPRTWGEPSRHAAARAASADHPHARGENCARGRSISVLIRTIPTHVGRTARASSCDRACADHPHARGENASPDGSSGH